MVEMRAGAPWVHDLGSSNGSTFNDAPLTAPLKLGPGDTVRFGSCSLRLDAVAVAPAGGTTRTIIGAATGSGTDGGIRQTSIDHVVANVDDLAVNHAMQSLGPGDETVTIMFSDIESSTERNLAVGDGVWIEVLQRHNAIFEQTVRHYGGTIIKNQGDGYMVTFGSARRALLCCGAIQKQLHEWGSESPEQSVRVRMGCHTGEAIHSDGDLFGRHVVIAARIANLAMGAQVLSSSIVRDITSARGDLAFADPQAVALKGVEGAHEVSEFLWHGAPES